MVRTVSNANGHARRAQVVYFSHGGGPMPILGDPGHQAMIDFMKHLPGRLHRPDAILVISAHWEESVPTLLGSANPPMLYDYFGFPREAYTITYPAPGHPALAARIADLLRAAGIGAGIDAERGFDHGHFIPLKMMYPQADIPSLQLSLVRGLDPERHLAVGRALAGLADENILVIGSGFSFHNLRAFSWQGSAPDPANDSFQEWLIDACTAQRSAAQRGQLLVDWEQAPSARYCHPREEHLLPLHVCVGMTGAEAGEKVFDDYIAGKRSVAFLW